MFEQRLPISPEALQGSSEGGLRVRNAWDKHTPDRTYVSAVVCPIPPKGARDLWMTLRSLSPLLVAKYLKEVSIIHHICKYLSLAEYELTSNKVHIIRLCALNCNGIKYCDSY